jgi:hypothetical protein
MENHVFQICHMYMSTAPQENHVKMEAAGPNAIDPIQAGRKNAWEIMFFKNATCTCQLRHRKTT